MKPIQFLLSTTLFCFIPQVVLAQNPCASTADTNLSSNNRSFQNKEFSFQVPANFRVIQTEYNLMIHSPWSYEMYMCQIQAQFGSGELEEGLGIKALSPSQASKYTQSLYDHNSPIKEGVYKGSSAKIFVWSGPESAYASILFIRNKKVIVLELPISSDENGIPSTKISEEDKYLVDLIIKSLVVK